MKNLVENVENLRSIKVGELCGKCYSKNNRLENIEKIEAREKNNRLENREK